MTEDLRVTCDQCGSWQIQYSRKVALPIRQVKLSDWVREPKSQPGVLQAVEMVAECQDCHFTVEYSRLENS